MQKPLYDPIGSCAHQLSYLQEACTAKPADTPGSSQLAASAVLAWRMTLCTSAVCLRVKAAATAASSSANEGMWPASSPEGRAARRWGVSRGFSDRPLLCLNAL